MTDGDRVTEAFRRLLSDASAGGQAKVDALVALSQRTVWVPTWSPDDEGFRTLVNSDGEAALPVFTGGDTLRDAAMRFAWQQPDGSVPSKEVGARAALRHAVAHELPFVVVDIGAPHSLEIERHELEPLMSPDASRSGSGPYAGVGKISSSMLRAVRPTPRPESDDAMPAVDPSEPPRNITPSPGQVPAQPASQEQQPQQQGGHRYRASDRPPPSTDAPSPAAPPPPPATPGEAPGVTVGANANAGGGTPGASATFGSGTSVTLHGLREAPPEQLLDALSTVLRGYPEVEWAALCAASRGPAEPVPTVGLRVDTTYRQRVNEIIGAIKQAGDANGATLDVLLLDDAELMRTARSEALVFYPWRRR